MNPGEDSMTGQDMSFGESECTKRYEQYVADAERYRTWHAEFTRSIVRDLLDRLGTTLIVLGRRLCARGGMEVEISFHPRHKTGRHAA
jgi:hypothetical protein